MNQPNDAGSSSQPSGPKRPYVKPALRYQRIFETRALVCGKVQTTQQGCHNNRKNS